MRWSRRGCCPYYCGAGPRGSARTLDSPKRKLRAYRSSGFRPVRLAIAPASSARFLRRRGTKKRYRASSVGQVCDVSGTVVLPASRSSTGRQALAVPSPTARRSSSLEGDVEEFSGGLSVFEALGDHAKRQGLHTGNGLVAIRPIGHHPGQGWHLGHPAAVVFAFKFDRESHNGYCTIRAGSLTSEWSRPAHRSMPRVAAARGSFAIVRQPYQREPGSGTPRLRQILLARTLGISVWRGTASTAPVAGFVQSECEPPSRLSTQPCWRRCRSNELRFTGR